MRRKVITFRVDNFITFCVDVITFCVSITFCGVTTPKVLLQLTGIIHNEHTLFMCHQRNVTKYIGNPYAICVKNWRMRFVSIIQVSKGRVQTS